MTLTVNKMKGCRVDSRRERPVSLPLDDGAWFCNSCHYSDLSDFLKPFNSQKDEIYRGRVGTENQRPGGRASSRSLAGRHGLIYHKAAGGPSWITGGLFYWR